MRTGSLSILLLFILFLLVSIKVTGQPNNLQWAKTYGGERNDSNIKVQTDFLGNNYVYINSNSDLLYTSGNQTLAINRGSKIIKYTANGSLDWEIQLPIGLILEGFESQGYAVNPDGTFFVLSKWTDALDMPIIDFGNNVIVDNTELYTDQTNNSASIIVKYSTSGQALWAKSIENKTITPETIKTASDIGFYLGGNNGGFSSDPTNFGNGVTLGANDLFGDIFIARFSSDGDAIWANSFGTENIDFLYDLEPDAQGNLFFSMAPFIPQAYGTITKLDGNGDAIWAKGVSSLSNSNLSFNTSNSLILTGELGTEDLFVDGIAEPILTTSAKDVPYLAIFNAENGGYQNGIVLDTLDHSDFFIPARYQNSENTIIVGGSYFFSESNRIEEITISKNIKLFENENQQATAIHYLAAYSLEGKALWAKKIVTDGYINLRNITFDVDGSIITSGIYDVNGEHIYQSQAGPNGRREAPLKFANGLMPEHKGDKDIFVAKFGEEESEICEIGSTITHCHRITDIPLYSRPKHLKTYNFENPSDDNIFNVCADGAQASLFKLNVTNANFECNNAITFQILNDGEIVESIDLYGKFQYEGKDNGMLLFNYQHPNWLDDDDDKYKDFAVKILNSNASIGEFILRVWRPGLLLVHGWLSNGDVFTKLKKELTPFLFFGGLYEDDFIYNPNFFSVANTSFSENDYFVLQYISQIINFLRDEKNVASGKVDIVAHSTGGLLVRSYIQSEAYQNNVHKLITVNTPHSGTQWANLVLDESRIFKQYFCTFINEFSFENSIPIIFDKCDSKVIQDISVGSSFLTELNQKSNKIPIHTIRTSESILDPFERETFRGTIGKTLKRIFLIAIIEAAIDIGVDYYLTNIIFKDNHDSLTPLGSQDGGMSSSETPGYCHTCVTDHMGDHWDVLDLDEDSDLIIESIVQRLKDNPVGENFTINEFKPQELTYTPDSRGLSFESSNLTMAYQSPTANEEFRWEETININIEMQGNYSELNLFVQNSLGDYNIYSFTSGNPSISVSASNLGIGRKKIVAVGIDTISNSFGVKTRYINITANTILDSIIIYPDYLLLSKGAEQLLSITGYLNNEIYDLTSSLAQFNFDNGGVVSSNENFLLGLDEGKDSIFVTLNNVKSNKILVEVFDNPNLVITSLEELSLTDNFFEDVKIFPNPTGNNLHVEYHLSKSQLIYFDLYNNIGQRIKSKKIRSKDGLNKTILNLENLSNGIYFFTIYTEKKRSTYKVLKN